MSATVRNLGGGGAKVQGYIFPASDSVSISGLTGATKTVALTVIGDGALSVSSSDSTKATASISGSTVTITAIASGSATITITMADSSTYIGTTATISVDCGIITIGSTYFFGGFYWTAAEDLGNNSICLQSQGMTAGSWPAYKLTTDYTGTKNYGSANTAYNGDIDGDNIANYDDVTSTWYSKYSAVEKTGASYGAGLFLVSNAKCGSTVDGTVVEGNVYADAIIASKDHVQATRMYPYLGTFSTAGTAWGINSGNKKLMSTIPQVYSDYTYPIGPAFNLDLTKVKLAGTNHDHILLPNEEMPTMVSFSAATPAQREAIVRAYEAGIIDITEYWSDGEEATATLPAIAASGTGWSVGESHAAQQVTLVLSLDNCKELTTPSANGQKYTKFLYHQKNGLEELGYMNSTNTNVGSWESSARRGWCNNGFKAAMIEAFGDIFHQIKNITAESFSGTTNQTSNDYFALPAAKEIKGGTASAAGADTGYSNLTEFNALKQFKYYETSANRIKKKGNSGLSTIWWGRSPAQTGTISNFTDTTTTGVPNDAPANSLYLIAPFGGV